MKWLTASTVAILLRAMTLRDGLYQSLASLSKK
jgi:hypothetical protein